MGFSGKEYCVNESCSVLIWDIVELSSIAPFNVPLKEYSL